MVSHWQEHHGHHKPAHAGYHNKEWAKKMKAIGLYPSSTGKPGGNEFGQRVSHYIIANGAYSYSYDRLAETGWTPTLESAPRAGSKKKDESKTPFTCRQCGQKAFGKPSLAILCMNCTIEALPDVAVNWRKLQMVTDEALAEAQSHDAAPSPDAETAQLESPANPKRPRPKRSKNKVGLTSYDGNAAAPSANPELEPDPLNEQLASVKAIADRMARIQTEQQATAANPKRRGRPPGSKNKPKPAAAA
jgi:hypothetical protein